MSFVERRLGRFREVLQEKGVDALLLANFHSSSPQGGDYSLYYLSNLLRRFHNCFLILTEGECRLWVEDVDLERAREQSWLEGVQPMEASETWGYSADEFARISARHVREMLNKETVKVGVDGRFLASSLLLSLMNEGLQLVDLSLELEKARLIKDEREVEMLRRAARIVDVGVERVMNSIQEGITEFELTVLAEYEMRREGAECFWWKSLLSSSPKAQAWADSPTERRIRRGDLVLMDFTPVYGGYGADIARSFVYGTPSEEQLKVFDLAKRALDEAASSLRSGVTIREVMEAAAAPVRGSPYERFYSGPGHGIGLYDDVYPLFLASTEKIPTLPTSLLEMKLVEGMTVAIEIIFTVPGLGGVRLEDDYLITKQKPERLTKTEILPSITP